MAWMRVLIPIFVFMHGFLTAPLLVECIPQDGSCLIEILGQDPCHENSGERPSTAGNNSGNSTLTGFPRPMDTCTDLMLESAAGIKACADYSAPLLQAAHDLIIPRQAMTRSELPYDIRMSRAGEGVSPAHLVTTRGILRI